MQQFQMASRLFAMISTSMLVCSVATEAAGQDYISLQEDGARLGELAASVQSCRHFGYETDGREVTALAEQRVRRAIMDGIDGRTASTLIADSIRRKGEDLQALNAGLSDTSNPERWARYAGELMADWVSRCQVMSETYPTAVIADGDEQAVTERFLAQMFGGRPDSAEQP